MTDTTAPGLAEAAVLAFPGTPAARLAPADLRDVLLLVGLTGAAQAKAQAALDDVGGLIRLLGAPEARIARLLGAKAAAALARVNEVNRRVLEAPLRERALLNSWGALVDYAKRVFAGRATEQARCLYLDKKNRLIADEVIGEGTVDHAPVYVREVIARALNHGACAIIMAHNHPSGDATPSREDVAMTVQVRDAARLFNIVLHDHIVVGGHDVVSLRARGDI